MNRITLLSAVLAMAVMTVGCGLKGDLYIPDEGQRKVQSTTISPGPDQSGEADCEAASGSAADAYHGAVDADAA